MIRTFAVLTLMAAAAVFAPRPALAESAECTEEYTQCLNDSYMTDGWTETMADVECFAGYLGCVAAKLTT